MKTNTFQQYANRCLLTGLFGLFCLLFQMDCEAAVSPGTGFVGANNSVGGGCSTCSGGNQSSQENFAVNLKIGMGQLLLGGASGYFYLSEITPGPQLAMPASLHFSGVNDVTNGLEVVSDLNGNVYQVVAPQAFATVVTNSAFSYQINIYSPQAKGVWNGTAYAVINEAVNLITVWTVANPDTNGVFNRLQITENPSGGIYRSWTYAYNTNNNVWTLAQPDGAMQLVSQITDTNTGNLVQTEQTADVTGAIIYSHSQVYTNCSWGQGLLIDTVGIGTDAQVTQYTYYPDGNAWGFTADGTHLPIQSIVHPDGGWQYYLGYDSQGRPTDVLSGIDGTLNTDPGSGRETTYDYSPVDPGDDGSIQQNTPRTVTVIYKSNVISLNYNVFKPGVQQSIQCLSPSASYNDLGNLVTTTAYYTNGNFYAQVQSVANPDGAMSFYNYATSATGESNTVTTGQPDPTGSYIVDGTKTVTVKGSVGQMLSQKNWDIASGLLLTSLIYTNYDTYMRPQTVVYPDRTRENTYYACCGVDSTISREGVLTQYYYDVMKRQDRKSTRLNSSH